MWIIAIFAAALGALGIWEFCRLGKLNKKKGLTELCMGIGVLTILSFFISTLDPSTSYLPSLLLFIGVVTLFFYHFDQIAGAITSISKSVFGVFYIAIPVGFILKILYFSDPGRGGSDGRLWLIYLLVVTKITDVGAYFGGRLLGNRKLAPQISPGKTLVGAVVGFLSAIVFSLLFYLMGQIIPHFPLSFTQSLGLGALLGVVGQVGDLAESLLKRDADVKDSNRLPGLGGILDMLDSLLFTGPILYFFLYLFNHGV